MECSTQGRKNVKVHFKLITHAGYSSLQLYRKIPLEKGCCTKGMCLFFPIWQQGKAQMLRGGWHGPATSQVLAPKIGRLQWGCAYGDTETVCDQMCTGTVQSRNQHPVCVMANLVCLRKMPFDL